MVVVGGGGGGGRHSNHYPNFVRSPILTICDKSIQAEFNHFDGSSYLPTTSFFKEIFPDKTSFYASLY